MRVGWQGGVYGWSGVRVSFDGACVRVRGISGQEMLERIQ